MANLTNVKEEKAMKSDDAKEKEEQIKKDPILANDGNFMARFLEMQQKEAEAKAKASEFTKPSSAQGGKGRSVSVIKGKLQPTGGVSAKSSLGSFPQNKSKGKTSVATTKSSTGTDTKAMTQSSLEDGDTGRKRKRSRWGVGPEDAVEIESGASSSISAPANPMDPVEILRLSTSKSLSKQIQQQRELQLLEQRVRDMAKRYDSVSAKKMTDAEFDQLELDRQREYEELTQFADDTFRDTVEDAERSGGVIEGGTWEHRKRAQEMLETVKDSITSTRVLRNRHFIGDFLPKDQLDTVLGSSRNGTSSAGPPAGPGSSTQPPDRMGVGFAQTEETEQEDSFDQYRKRMMLAYRFRPNPLVRIKI